MKPSLTFATGFFSVACILATTHVAADDNASKATNGKALLATHCARCHSIDKTGSSPLRNAPPLRYIYRDYPIERLEFELSEGIGSRHPAMPQIQFLTEQIDTIVKYLESLAVTK